ncbi:MAG: hypothetical protein NVSMB52_18350 [Chloroflexota bacterium]
MVAHETKSVTAPVELITVLPSDRHWQRLAVVASGVPDASALSAIREIARRDSAQIVLYDVAASAGFTSPYPPGGGVQFPELLQEADLRRVGSNDLAAVAHELAEEGLLAGVYLAPKTNAADLAALVAREGVDLVISVLPPDDRRLDRIHEARRHAHVLLAPTGERPVLHWPLEPGEEPPVSEGIRWPYLIVILVTFLLARVRSQA